MVEIIKVLTYISVSIAEVMIFVNFLSAMQKKIYSGAIWSIICIGMSVLVSGVCMAYGGTYFNVIFSLIFYSLASIILYEGRILYKVFFGILMVLLGIISELLAGFILAVVSETSIDVQLKEPMFFLLGAFTSKIILIFLFQLIIRIKKTKSDNIPLNLWIMLISTPIGSAVIANFIVMDRIYKSNHNIVPVFVSLFILLFINIMTFILFDKLLLMNDLQIKNLEAENKINLQTEHYTRIMENHKNIRSIWHDMNNHFIVMNKLIEQNEYSKLEAYIAKLYNKNSKEGYLINTGNYAIDALLDEKFVLSQNKDIELDLHIDLPVLNNINSMDICIILGNMMDNAIEACEGIVDKDNEKKISVRIKYEKGFLIFSVANTYSTLKMSEDGKFITSKKDSDNHGFGLNNVRRIVDKYCGEMDIDTTGEIFSIKTVLKID